MTAPPSLPAARRVVIKIGSALVVDDVLRALAREIVHAR